MASTTASYTPLDTLPPNHAALPPTTTIALSDYDQLMTGNHIIPCCVFAFGGDRAKAAEHLRAGLGNVLGCLPVLGGRLVNDERGHLSVMRRNSEAIPLGIVNHDADGNFPSYANLANNGFTPSFFTTNAARLTPPDQRLGGLRRDDGCPVAAFQVNFIAGGLILTLALHHTCGDAHSIDHIFRLWAKSTRAASQGVPPPHFTPVLDRTAFNADPNTLSAQEIDELRNRVKGYVYTPVVKDSAGPALPQIPEVRIGVYHVSSATCAALKKACTPSAHDPSVPFVSSYDVLAALSWRCATRARQPLLKLDQNTATVGFSHAVDTRMRFPGAPPEEYFGNAFNMTACDRLPISQLLDDDGLASAAHAIRRSIQAVGPHSIRDPLNLRQALVETEDLQFGFLPENTVYTSWTVMKPMQTYDFGWGLPSALRIPVAPYGGVGGILPASRSLDGTCDGFDAFMVLEVESHDRFCADPEWLQYCTPLGN